MHKPSKKPQHLKRPNYAQGGPVIRDGKQYLFNGGGAASGALGGAATGAAVGSVVPVIGTAIGAVGGAIVGGLAGGFSGGNNNALPPISDPINPQDATNSLSIANQGQLNQAGYAAYLQSQGGAANQTNAYNQFGNIANGTGPNPAQAALNQNTQANIANQAALAAGQRGASANVGLAQRNAALAGSNAQQQSVGQAATLQAEQQLNAIGQQANIAGQQVGETQASQQAAENSALQTQTALLGAQGTYNTNLTSGQGSVNAGNTSSANTTQTNLVPLAQGALSGAGASTVAANQPNAQIQAPRYTPGYAMGGQIAQGPHNSHVANYLFAGGGEVKAMVSAGERYLNPEEVRQVIHEGKNPLKLGTKFEGKAKVKGDSLKNDTIPRDLQEGGVVIDRKTMNKKSREAAELFVHKAVHMKAPKGK